MVQALKSLKVVVAGWVTFLLACLIGVDHAWYIHTHNTVGSPVIATIVASLLGFTAAAFGITAYDKRGPQ